MLNCGVELPNLLTFVLLSALHFSQAPALCQTRPLHRMAVLKIANLHGRGRGFSAHRYSAVEALQYVGVSCELQ